MRERRECEPTINPLTLPVSFTRWRERVCAQHSTFPAIICRCCCCWIRRRRRWGCSHTSATATGRQEPQDFQDQTQSQHHQSVVGHSRTQCYRQGEWAEAWAASVTSTRLSLVVSFSAVDWQWNKCIGNDTRSPNLPNPNCIRKTNPQLY